ncbi:IMP dehydrogenase [Patescibacteria group bacterium]|nr:IMP dehydrogenase [Patescibacteria group bacterium]
MEKQSGIALKDLLGDSLRSYNLRDIDILEGVRAFSRNDTVVDTSGYFSKNIKLHIPLVTAPMPDVTDEHIAIIAARNGALGIIPMTYEADEQAEIIRRVKAVEGGFIEHPFTLSPRDTLKRALCAPFSNIPIIDSGKLVGMFVRQKYGEYYYASRLEKSLDTVMEKDLARIAVERNHVTAEGILNFKRAQALMQERMIPVLAVMNTAEQLLALVTMKDVASNETHHQKATRDRKNRLVVGAAVFEYMTDDNLSRIQKLVDAEIDVLVIEQAHAWNEDTGRMTRYLKKTYPHIDMVVGNDSVREAVRFHRTNGADGIKIGQGPGSACLTGEEDVVGIWRPQLSAIYDCAETAFMIAKESDKEPIPCNADGGIQTAYDAFKALAAGAQTIMVGKLVAQCKDSPAKETEPGKKMFRAMGSPEIARTHASASKRYNLSGFVAEGTTLSVTVTGSLEEFLKGFHAKLQRIFERAGARNIAELHEKLRDCSLRAQHAHNRHSR